MLTIFGQGTRHCDGVSRRDFLKVGALGCGAGGLGLADLLRDEATAGDGGRSSHKAVINIWLNGGPPHHEMWDPKPGAPVEIRGEFQPIATRVPGIQIGEMFPRIAAAMDRYAIIRSIVGSVGQHDPYQCMTGWPGVFSPGAAIATTGRPSLGSVVARLKGPVDVSVPPYVMEGPNKIPASDLRANAFKASYLGPAYAPFEPDGPDMANLTLQGITLDRLRDRRRLLGSFDGLRREMDARGTMEAMDAFNKTAVDVLTSSRLVEAFDLSREPVEIRARYGSSRTYKAGNASFVASNEHFLLARRLVEAGVRCVTLNWGSWDTHADNFSLLRGLGPQFDQGLSGLIDDLHQRGLSEDVTVIAWGEFGRTSRINKDAGRDHWPFVNSALLAGGGMRLGQVIGSTDRAGEYAQNRPVHFQEVFATLYRNLGIDTASTTIRDSAGRPQYLVERQAIRELI